MGKRRGRALPVTDLVPVPGWVWPVIWVSLTTALLAILALSAWVIFRKAMKVMDALGELADRGSLLDLVETEHVAPAIAVLAAAGDIHGREEARRVHRAELARARHEQRILRARRITNVDATQRDWPADWVS